MYNVIAFFKLGRAEYIGQEIFYAAGGVLESASILPQVFGALEFMASDNKLNTKMNHS